MNFHRLSEAPQLPYDIVFRHSFVKQAVFLAIFLSISAAIVLIGYLGGIHGNGWNLPSPLAYYMAAVMALLSAVAFTLVRATLRRTNWVLRYDGDRLLIKYRSFLNHHFPKEDPVVAEVSLTEVKWIRALKEKRVVPDLKNETVEHWTYLDVCLNHSETEMLRERLKQERTRWPKTRGFVRSRSSHCPVRLIGNDLIRIVWTGMTPDIRKALEIFREKVEIEDIHASEVSDLTALAERDQDEQEKKIRELAEGGDRLAAMKVVRTLYGVSTTEAVQYIRNLLGEEK